MLNFTMLGEVWGCEIMNQRRYPLPTVMLIDTNVYIRIP